MTNTKCLKFVKSTYSGGDGGNCVEWAFDSSGVHVRDSKDRLGAALLFTPVEWTDVVTKAADGVPHDSIKPFEQGVRLVGPGGELHFSGAEWEAFTAGARAGECSPALHAAIGQ